MEESEKGKVIQFPQKGNVLNNNIKIDNSAVELRDNIIFTDNLTEGLVINMIHNMSENGIDVDSVDFVKDTSFLIEFVKSTIYRSLDMGHPMQNLVDLFVSSEIDGKKMNVTVDTDFMQDVCNDIMKEDEKE